MTTTNNAQTLQEFNFLFLLDGSASMGTEDMKGGRSRWTAMQEQVEAFARDIEKIDSDGMDVVLFNAGRIETFNNVTSSKVHEIFASRSPRGGTPMAEALQQTISVAKRSDKKAFIVVVTDGVPDEKQSVIDVITRQANSQTSDDQMTILFLQIGYDSDAKQYLQKLDDNLKTKFDIVDAKTMEEAEAFPSTTDLILAAIDG